MTREELQDIKAEMKYSGVDPDQAGRLVVALEAAWAECDQLTRRIQDLERGEYICKQCGLRKAGESQPAEF